MKRIQEDFKLKDNKIEPPDLYLRATLAEMKLESGKYYWTILPEQYVKAAVTNVEKDLTGRFSYPRKEKHSKTPTGKYVVPHKRISIVNPNKGKQRGIHVK